MIGVAATALLLTALPADAQTAAPAPQAGAVPQAPPADMTPPPAFMAAAQAFGQCVGTKAQAQPATAAPEVAARTALAGCAAERTALDTSFESWIASPTFPAAGRAMAREQYKAQMAAAEGQIASKIREGRAQATPAPAPTPSATPTAPR